MSVDAIHGVTLTPRKVIWDQRGAVLHFLRRDDPAFSAFGEVYFSETLPGVVKAWKRHQRMTQCFIVPAGRMRFVLHDDRANSPSQGRTEEVVLGRPDAYALLRVPPLVWYGFAAVGNQPALIANCSDLPHDPAESETRPHNDPSMPKNAWPKA